MNAAKKIQFVIDIKKISCNNA